MRVEEEEEKGQYLNAGLELSYKDSVTSHLQEMTHLADTQGSQILEIGVSQFQTGVTEIELTDNKTRYSSSPPLRSQAGCLR